MSTAASGMDLQTANASFRRTQWAGNKSERTIEAYTDGVRFLADFWPPTVTPLSTWRHDLRQAPRAWCSSLGMGCCNRATCGFYEGSVTTHAPLLCIVGPAAADPAGTDRVLALSGRGRHSSAQVKTASKKSDEFLR
jgi:hypothetical protein